MVVEIDMNIGKGITMKCNFKIESSIEANELRNDFKMVLRSFLKQLYEAKEKQIDEEKQKW